MGKTTKFLLSRLQQDSDRGRSCSCSRTFLQRCTTGTGCCSPVLCAGVRAQPAPGQEQPGLLQRPSEEKEGILFRPEPFRGSVQGCRNPQEALLSSLEHFSSHKYNNNNTTQWAVPSVRNALHSAKGLCWGKRVLETASPTPAAGLKNTATPCYRHRATCNFCTLSLHQIDGVLLFFGRLIS